MEEPNNCKASSRNQAMPTTYIQKQDILYIIEHDRSPNAKETVSEKIKKLILRDSSQLYSRKLKGFIAFDFIIDFLSATCKNIRNAWRLSGRRQ